MSHCPSLHFKFASAFTPISYIVYCYAFKMSTSRSKIWNSHDLETRESGWYTHKTMYFQYFQFACQHDCLGSIGKAGWNASLQGSHRYRCCWTAVGLPLAVRVSSSHPSLSHIRRRTRWRKKTRLREKVGHRRMVSWMIEGGS